MWSRLSRLVLSTILGLCLSACEGGCGSTGDGNRAPSALGQVVEVFGNEDTTITLSGTDPDGNALTFTVVTPPSQGALSGVLPAVTYLSNPGFVGSDSFTFTVSDKRLTSPAATVTLNVSAPTAIYRVSEGPGAVGWNDDTQFCGLSASGRHAGFLNQPSLHLRDALTGTFGLAPPQVDMIAQNIPSLSADGRIVAYSRLSAGISQVYAYDRQTATEEPISVSSSGTIGGAHSYAPSISADGRFVSFHSDAENLVSDDDNGFKDVFVRDRLAGTTQRISLPPAGGQGNEHSSYSAISGNGRFVAFQSRAGNLVLGDLGGADDVFVFDRQTGTMERIEAESTVERPAISFDGRYVAFTANKVDTIGPSNNKNDVYLHDRQTSTTVEILAPGGALPNNHSSSPSISGDGRYVVYSSLATNLVAGDINNVEDIFVYDVQTTEVTRASVNALGVQGNGASQAPVISRNGRYIGFHSAATNLIDGDANGVLDVFVAPNPPPVRLPPTKLAFSVQPSNTYVGAPITPAVRVVVQDATGITVETSTDTVTLQIGTNPGGGTLSGTLVVDAVGGVAILSGLSIDSAGNGYTLQATSGALAPGTSASFNVLPPPPPDHLAFSVAPSTQEEQGIVFTTFAVEIRDALNQLITSDSTTQITITVASGTGILGGTITRTATNGVAIFDNLTYSVAESVTLGATSSPSLPLGTAGPVVDVQASPAPGIPIYRASEGPGGVQWVDDTQYCALSASSRYSSFLNQPSLYVRDSLSGALVQPAVQVDMIAQNIPSASANGRLVAYSRLSGPTSQVYVYDRQTGTEELVSANSDEVVGNNHSYAPSISADGRYVSFHADASNLVPGDSNGWKDVFVRDRLNGTTERISVPAGGGQGNDDSSYSAISGNGRFVAFQSKASNLTGGDGNGSNDVFVYDRQTGAMERIDAESTIERPAISFDGRYVAYAARDKPDLIVPNNNKADIFLHDRQSGTTAEVSALAGVLPDDHSASPSISGDGRYVVFSSLATNLVVGDSNNVEDVFVYDAQTLTVSRVSVNSLGGQAGGASQFPTISRDGRYVGFHSAASDLTSSDSNNALDVFIAPRP